MILKIKHLKDCLTQATTELVKVFQFQLAHVKWWKKYITTISMTNIYHSQLGLKTSNSNLGTPTRKASTKLKTKCMSLTHKLTILSVHWKLLPDSVHILILWLSLSNIYISFHWIYFLLSDSIGILDFEDKC